MPHERGHDTRMPIGFLSHSPFANHVAHELSWSSQTGEQESPQLSPQLRSIKSGFFSHCEGGGGGV